MREEAGAPKQVSLEGDPRGEPSFFERQVPVSVQGGRREILREKAGAPKQVSLEGDPRGHLPFPNGRFLSRHKAAGRKFCGKKQARPTLVERGGRAEAGFLGRGTKGGTFLF